MRQLVEQALGDRVVAALAVPHAALVAAAEMDAEGHARKIFHQLGVGAQRAREILHRLLAALAHRLERRLVDVRGVARLVDMHVAAAGVDQLLDHAALDRDDVVHERIHGRIDRFGTRMVEALHHAVGSDQGDLDRLFCNRGHASVFIQWRIVPARERRAAGDAPLVRAHGLGASVVAADGEAEAVLEVEAAHFAVGDDVEADALLQVEVTPHAFQLHARELLGRELAGFQCEAGLLPVGGAQQAADDVGADAIEAVHWSWRIPAAFTAAA